MAASRLDAMFDSLTEIESMCPRCEENGTTKLLTHTIPYFKNVLISSFECDHCGHRNNEVLPISEIQPMGEVLTLRAATVDDLDRQVIKSEHATIRIPELDFDIPPNTQRGISSTVQGMLSQAADNLLANQAQRLAQDPQQGHKISEFIRKLQALFTVRSPPIAEPPAIDSSNISSNIPPTTPTNTSSKMPNQVDRRVPLEVCFTFQVDDPSGNSFIENPEAPAPDPRVESHKYARTTEQLHAMGYYEEQDLPAPKRGADLPSEARGGPPGNSPESSLKNEENQKSTSGQEGPAKTVVANNGQHAVESWDLSKPLDEAQEIEHSAIFVMPCSRCGAEGQEKMCEIDIPGFRKCWVMAFTCDHCGYKSNEVKPGGRYGDQGKRWELRVQTIEDLNRDVLKADTAAIRFPELDLELAHGTLGGVFTTIEGLLVKIADEMNEKIPFQGDSQFGDRKEKLTTLIETLRGMAAGDRLPFILILDDMADLSHIGRRNSDVIFSQSQATQNQKPTREKRGEKSGGAEHAPGHESVVSEDTQHAGQLDPQLTTILYDRDFEQNDSLGINDMRVYD